MKKIDICVFLLFITTSLIYGQENIRLKGQIIDDASKQGIAFANVYVKDKGFGVISNGEGAFLLNYKGTTTNDTLVISCLGYFEKRISISKVLADKQYKFNLVPQFYSLSEVKISEPLTAKQLIKLAIKNYEKNYPSNPFVAEGYFREFTKQDDTFIRFFEASASVYDDARIHHVNFLYPNRIIKVRYYDKSPIDVDKYYWLNSLTIMVGNDWGYNSLPHDADDDYTIDSTFYQDGKKYYVLLNDNSNKHIIEKTKYIIRDGDYAIVRISIVFFDKEQKITKWKTDKGIIYADNFKKIVLDKIYIDYQGKVYPKYMAHTTSHDYYKNEDINSKLFTFEIITDMAVNDITENAQEIPDELQNTDWRNLSAQSFTVDSSFWKSYNYIVDDSIKKQAVLDLEKSKKKFNK